MTEQNLAEGRLYPPLDSIREVSLKIAVKVSISTLISTFHGREGRNCPGIIFALCFFNAIYSKV